MSHVRFRFYRGSGILAWLVRTVTRSSFAHVEPIIDGFRLVAVPGRRVYWSAAPDVQGVELIVEVDDIVKCRRACSSALFAKYDLFGALYAGTRLGREHPDRWFCSEIAAEVANAGGVFVGDPHQHTPGSLYNALKSYAKQN